MGKEILFGEKARTALCIGVNKIADAVRVTMGYNGKHVIVSNPQMFSFATKDGVSVANEVSLNDPIENAGALIIKGVARRMLSDVGDGTTCATLLAQILINEGLNLVQDKKGFWSVRKGANAVEIKKGMDAAVEYVVDTLSKMAIPVEIGSEELRHIATISANNDAEMGKQISDIFSQIGKDGIVDVKESKTSKKSETFIEIVDGVQFPSGYNSPFFINNHAKQTCELDNVCILVYDGVISSTKEVLPIAKFAGENDKAMVLIAEDIGGEAMQTILLNRSKANAPICCIKTTAFGDYKTQLLEDIAIATGATYLAKGKGEKLERLKADPIVGFAKRVIISKDKAVFMEPEGKKEAIEARLQSIKNIIAEHTTDEHDKKRQQERLGRFLGKTAIMYVGYLSDMDKRDKFDRIDDAVRATRAAIDEGVLPGAGTAYIRCMEQLDHYIAIRHMSPDYEKGMRLVMEVLEMPLAQICINAGKNPELIIKMVKNSKGNFGYSGKSEQVKDLFKAGVLDPAKVCKQALLNAASVAGILITSEALMVEIEKK